MSSKITKNKRKSTSEQLKRLTTLKTAVKSDEPVNSFEITVKHQFAKLSVDWAQLNKLLANFGRI